MGDNLINMNRTHAIVLGLCVNVIFGSLSKAPLADGNETASPGTGARHAIAMHGAPRYEAGFSGFDHVDPFAIKGGELAVGEVGTFDSLNPFIVQGNSPKVRFDFELNYLVVQLHAFESLMMRGQDEPFSLYGLIARTVEVPDDRSWIEFELRPEARFSDGSSITIEDVIFSWATLKEQGRPNMRRFYSLVRDVQRTAPNKVRFVFEETGNRELPLIMGLMPILSKSFHEPRDFGKSSLDPPIGSGPYTISEVVPGRRLVFTRNPNYWAENLAVNRGHHNFDSIRYEFFRDEASLLEAFKKGDVLIRYERSAKNWATAYDSPAMKDGRIQRRQFPHGRTADMYGFVFNTRREIFKDERVRNALIHLFDFEWMNKNLFYGTYERVKSYFGNSDLSSNGKPAGPLELKLLSPYLESVKPKILANGWQAPQGGSPAAVRSNKRKALQLFGEAGWSVSDGRLVNQATSEPFEFEIMVQLALHQRIALIFAKSLENLGLDVNIRMVDNLQFIERQQTYDFDMLPERWQGTLSPGNEQLFRFGSKEADIEGTFNYAGVKSDAVDTMIAAMTNAQTREELVAATHALDRILLSGHYVIPFYHSPADRIAYWSQLQPPNRVPLTGTKIDTWWMRPAN